MKILMIWNKAHFCILKVLIIIFWSQIAILGLNESKSYWIFQWTTSHAYTPSLIRSKTNKCIFIRLIHVFIRLRPELIPVLISALLELQECRFYITVFLFVIVSLPITKLGAISWLICILINNTYSKFNSIFLKVEPIIAIPIK